MAGGEDLFLKGVEHGSGKLAVEVFAAGGGRQVWTRPEEAVHLRGHNPVLFRAETQASARGRRELDRLVWIAGLGMRNRRHGYDLFAVDLLDAEDDNARSALLAFGLALDCLALPEVGVADDQAGNRDRVLCQLGPLRFVIESRGLGGRLGRGDRGPQARWQLGRGVHPTILAPQALVLGWRQHHHLRTTVGPHADRLRLHEMGDRAELLCDIAAIEELHLTCLGTKLPACYGTHGITATLFYRNGGRFNSAGAKKGAVSAMMQALGLRYVRYINQVYRRTGTLFDGRFKSSLVQSERYLLTCYRYIELNPVRAAMVADPADYRWKPNRVRSGVNAAKAPIQCGYTCNHRY